MAPLSRREFGRLVAAGVPLAALRAIPLAARRTVTVGVSTSSFRELPRVTGRDNIDDVIAALRQVHATHVELAFANLEPAPPSTASFMGGSNAYPKRVVLSPEEVASTNAAARAELRRWRLATPPSTLTSVRDKFAAAGMRIHACSLKYDDAFTDEEVVATFRQASALGVTMVSTPMTMATAARIAPMAEGHGITIAIHNQPDGNAAGLIATSEIAAALALSRAIAVKLDIGHLTAANHDALAELGAREPRVALVALRDRLRNGGASQPFGEGDTPIVPVLRHLAASAAPVPVFVDYDYVGLRPAAVEVAAALAFVASAID